MMEENTIKNKIKSSKKNPGKSKPNKNNSYEDEDAHWYCFYCTYANTANAKACQICGKNKKVLTDLSKLNQSLSLAQFLNSIFLYEFLQLQKLSFIYSEKY